MTSTSRLSAALSAPRHRASIRHSVSGSNRQHLNTSPIPKSTGKLDSQTPVRIKIQRVASPAMPQFTLLAEGSSEAWRGRTLINLTSITPFPVHVVVNHRRELKFKSTLRNHCNGDDADVEAEFFVTAAISLCLYNRVNHRQLTPKLAATIVDRSPRHECNSLPTTSSESWIDDQRPPMTKTPAIGERHSRDRLNLSPALDTPDCRTTCTRSSIFSTSNTPPCFSHYLD